jgi:hypothetical protein
MVGGTRGGWLVGGRGVFSGSGGFGCVGATIVLPGYGIGAPEARTA